jgi:stress response protein SCP2
MAINLQKGQRISLEKEAPGLTKVMCGLGWDVAQSSGGLFGLFGENKDFDLDSSVFCLDAKQHLKNTENIVYFGNLSHKSGAIIHLGDNLTGKGSGDDEQILIELTKIPSDFHKLVFIVNIYNCLQRKQNFGMVNNAFVRLVDTSNNREIARYNLSGREYQDCTGMIMAEIYREGNHWEMEAIGRGIRISNLQELVTKYS